MKFMVSKDFFEKVPNAFFGVIIVKNFDNMTENNEIEDMLKENTLKAARELENVKVKESELIIPYREAFNAIGINPNKYMCSIEALLTRISKGKELPNINPIVDLGNALSVKYALPIGIHDIDNFDGNIEIRKANSNDSFIPFGSEEIEKVDENEFVYVSGNEVKTRKWTWRQGEKSKITNNSKNLFIPIDGFDNINKNKVLELQEELIKYLQNNYNVEIKSGYVDKEHNEFIW